MRRFICLLRPSGEPIQEGEHRRYLPLCPRFPSKRFSTGGFTVHCESDGVGIGPAVASNGILVAVGDVRLDNPDEVARLGAPGPARQTDLDLVLAAYQAHGGGCVPVLLGDFAFVVWNTSTRQVFAARDALGVRPLYYRLRPELFAFSSHASLITAGDDLDRDYIASFLVNGFPTPGATIYPDVRGLPPATTWHYSDGKQVTERYWSASDFPIDYRRSGDADRDTFRALFADAVRSRLTGHADTWSQLSGGLDSASVVSMSQYLAGSGDVRHGVGGTVTIVESLGGDEREFSDSVVRQFALKNEQVVDCWMWQDDGSLPPCTDQPEVIYPFFLRDRRMCAAVRRNGGRVLLSGFGSDQYLTGNYLFFADWLARGRRLSALKEIVRWATIARTSAWSFGFKNALVPLLPNSVRRRWTEGTAVPAWIDRKFARRFDVGGRFPLLQLTSAAAGHKYEGYIAQLIDNTASGIDRGVLGDELEMRYPFLSRRLIEFCLTLPPAMRTGPVVQKRILREAMVGILPEPIRTRTTKGAVEGRMEWSLCRERERLAMLLKDPLVSQFGCVDAGALRTAVRAAQAGKSLIDDDVIYPLSLETWLSVRFGRWSADQVSSQSIVSKSHPRTAFAPC